MKIKKIFLIFTLIIINTISTAHANHDACVELVKTIALQSAYEIKDSEARQLCETIAIFAADFPAEARNGLITNLTINYISRMKSPEYLVIAE